MRADEAVGQATAFYYGMSKLVAALVIAGCVLGVLVGLLTRGAFRRSSVASRRRRSFWRGAEGDLRFKPASHSGGESLMTALVSMQARLKQMVIAIHESRTAIRSSAGEIGQGNLDLSQRTEEQAASLEQTAASMQELTERVRRNTEHASDARSRVTRAAEEVGRSEQAVGDMIRAMEIMVEGTTRMKEMIGVIEGVAFQTTGCI